MVAIDYDPGASEVNQLNRLKLMLSTANKHLNAESKTGKDTGSSGRNDKGHGTGTGASNKTVNTQTADNAAGNQTAAMKNLPEGGADVTGNEDAAVQTA